MKDIGGPNLNTFVTVAGFVITIGGGLVLYGAERAENQMRHAQTERRLELLESGRTVNSNAIQAAQVQVATMTSELGQVRRELAELKQDLRETLALLRAGNGGKAK